MMDVPSRPVDYAAQLRANWAVLSDPAALRAAGLTVLQPTPEVLASLPPVATAAVAAVTPAGRRPLQIAKYAQIVSGRVIALVDDGSAADDAALAHFAVTVITAGALPVSGMTYQLAARPQGSAITQSATE
jgi:hypothetical protein